MKPTTEGSDAFKYDILCISFGKEKEKGLKVIQGASKNSIFDEEMIIKAENGKLRKNNTLESENGKIIRFEEKAFEILKNRKEKTRKISKSDREIE